MKHTSCTFWPYQFKGSHDKIATDLIFLLWRLDVIQYYGFVTFQGDEFIEITFNKLSRSDNPT